MILKSRLWRFQKNDVGSADALASTDYNWDKENFSRTCVSFEDKVTQKNYTGISAFEYAYNVKSTDVSFYSRNVFFEKGEYVYNAAIEISTAIDEAESIANAFFNSIIVEEADPSVVGTILRNFDELEGTTKIDDVEDCFINIPNAYTKLETSSEKELMYYDELRGTTISISYLTDKNYTAKGIEELARQALSQVKKDGGTELQRVTSGTFDGKKGSEYAYKKTIDGQTFCVEVKMFLHRDRCYTFIAVYPELMFSEKARSLFNSITNSIYFF